VPVIAMAFEGDRRERKHEGQHVVNALYTFGEAESRLPRNFSQALREAVLKSTFEKSNATARRGVEQSLTPLAESLPSRCSYERCKDLRATRFLLAEEF